MAVYTGDANVIGGPWAYIYAALGFVVAIEGIIIEMMHLDFPGNLIVYIVLGLFTGWQFLFNAKFQNKLIEERPRRRRAAEQRDELAALQLHDHSITSSASARSAGGISRPSVF